MAGDTKTFTIRNHYTRDIPIDDGLNGEAVASGETFPVRIRRLSVAQAQEFRRGWSKVMNPTAERYIFRKPDSDEQEKRDIPAVLDDKGVIVTAALSEHAIADDEIKRRRLEEMNDETRAQYDAADQADKDYLVVFCSEAIDKHVSVAPGFQLRAQRADSDEVFDVKTGKDLLETFGGNLSMLTRLAGAVHVENSLSPELKKGLRLLSGLTASSPTPALAAGADGATPAATATNAEAADSALPGAAPVAPAPIPSGSDALATTSS